jgi:hypothetical protein
VESSLAEISAGATVDLTFGRNYTSTTATKILTIDNLGSSVAPGMLDIQGVTVTAAGGIDLNSGSSRAMERSPAGLPTMAR